MKTTSRVSSICWWLRGMRRQSPGIEPDHLVIESRKAALVLGDQLWLETAITVTRNVQRQAGFRRQHSL